MRLFVLKPDGIGDFVLATGAIRLMAESCGEQNLTLCVKPMLVSLARAQFPKAEVLELPVASQRKVVNLFARNLAYCLPLVVRLRFRQFDASVCLRSMRNYLESLIFYAAGARRRVAIENILLRSGRKVRMSVERSLQRIFQTELPPYPDQATEVPLEIEANRRIVEQLLTRPVSASEVIPKLLAPARKNEAAPYWILAPLTSTATKNYPFQKWASLFSELPADRLPARVYVAGSAGQRSQLEEMVEILKRVPGVHPELLLPTDLVEFTEWIAGADLILTLDTAAAHFSTALDQPTLVLFSGLHTGMFGPWHRSERQQWLLPDSPTEKSKPKWHDRIPPQRAAACAMDLLDAAGH